MQKKSTIKSTPNRIFKFYIVVVAIIFTSILLGIFYFLRPMIIEEYCAHQARKIVGTRWNKLYPAEGSEKQYVTQITWGFREQLKCERKFR